MRMLWLVAVSACNGLLGQRAGILDEDASVDRPVVTPAPDAILGARLVLWLDASAHETIVHDAKGTVIGWRDRSAARNNAVVRAVGPGHVSVASAANGHDAIHFEGDAMATAVLEIADAQSLDWSMSDFTIAIAASWLNASGTDPFSSFGYLWSKSELAWPELGLSVTANMTSSFLSDGTALGPDSYVFGGVRSCGAGWNAGTRTAHGGYADGRLHLIVVRRTGSTRVDLLVDGELSTNEVTPTDVDVPPPIFIGGRFEGDVIRGPLQGNVAEVMGAAGAVTDGEMDMLAKYLSVKY